MHPPHQSHGALVAAATEDPDVALILVVGESQSGKTKLVNLLSRSNLATGHGAASCTHHLQLSKPFEHEGIKVILIDTPGLEHTYREESKIFQELALFLVDVYKKGKVPRGLIYVQSITDHWKSATAVRSMTLINKMCGDDVIKNLIIASTARPSLHLSDEDRASREAQISGAEWGFKPFIEAGATLISHKNLDSARRIVAYILEQRPVPLLIQTELEEDQKTFQETSLGSALFFGTEGEVLYNHEKYMKELITDMSKLRMDLTSHYLGWNAVGHPNHHGYHIPRPAHSLLCNICGEGIYGVRYKCVQCPSYDACTNCYYYIPEMHPMHTFIRLNGLEAAAYRTAPVSYAPSQFASCCGALAAPVRQNPYTQCISHFSPGMAPSSHGGRVSALLQNSDTSASLV